MRYEEFTGQVQAVASLSGRQGAERSVRATLETLAERIPDALAEHLAAQLPGEYAQSLTGVAAAHQGEPQTAPDARWRGESFDLASFAGRVAWRCETNEDEALRRSSAVLEVLDAAVAPELMEKLAEVLPADIAALLPAARTDDPEE